MHHWQIAGEREVPWQALPITVRVCRRCGCEKIREPWAGHFRPVYVLGGVVTNNAPACPGERGRA